MGMPQRREAASGTIFLDDLLSELTPGNTIYVDAANGSDTADGRSWSSAKQTIQAAINAAASGDEIRIAPGGYEESVTIAATKPNLILRGVGGRGSVFIEPSAADAEGLQVLADDITLINVGVAGDDTGDYALKVGSQTVSPARFRAYACKFELADGAGPAVLLQGAGDVLLSDCEFCYAAAGVRFQDNDDGRCTQVFIQDSRFHNLATVGVGVLDANLVKNLQLHRNVFDNKEDGTAPTDYILLSDNANTGHISKNEFATATNATGVLTIGTGLKWTNNGTEAGGSTARPA